MKPDPAVLRQAAGRLSEQWPLESLPLEVEDWFETAERERGSWLVLCSGGADSVALLLWLYGAFPERRGDLRVLHVNHRLRGPESDLDASFVADLAGALEVRVRVVHKEPPDALPGEAALRDLREEAVAAACRREPVEGIFFGHQADDVAENILFRLARGSGLSGLSGMRPRQDLPARPPRLRPLLQRTRIELRSALRELGVDWREDASNETDVYTRNRLRRTTVPAWSKAVGKRDLYTGLHRSHRELREADEAIAHWSGTFLASQHEGRIELKGFNELPRAVRRRILQDWWQAQEAAPPPLPAATLDRLLEWAAESTAERFPLAGGAIVSDGRRWTWIPSAASEETLLGAGHWSLQRDEALVLPTGARLTAAWRELDDELREAIRAGTYTPKRLVFLCGVAEPLQVRAWQPGDRFRPLGAPGRRKLQDAFTDAGVPRVERHRLPVVCDRYGAILWVPGLPPADAHRVEPGATGALWLTYSVT